MIVAVLQARASSRRLPGKVLKPILGKPMLQHQIERVLRARLPQRLVLATSVNADDDPIAELGAACGIAVYRGSLDDVLDRFYRAAKPYAPSHVVRLTGDCPLADPTVIDAVIRFAVDGKYDYASNTIRPTFPDGLDVEVATFAALRTAWQEATSKLDREHVMPFLHRQPERFRLGNYENDSDLSAMRWTVDEPADFEMVRAVYEALYPHNPEFRFQDIINLITKNPQIAATNSNIARNEGLNTGMTFRAAGMEDARRLFEWRNDPQTREASRSSDPIPWESHIAWLTQRLGAKEPHLYIVEIDGVPIGTFRIDGEEISYTIALESRGKRLGHPMLAMAAKCFGPKTALVKRRNIASARVAQEAGHKVVILDE